MHKKEKMRNLLWVIVLAFFASGCDDNHNNVLKKYGLQAISFAIDSTTYLANNVHSPKCEVSIQMQCMRGKNAPKINQALIQSGFLVTNSLSQTNESTDMEKALRTFVSQYMDEYINTYGPLYRADSVNPTTNNRRYQLKSELQNNQKDILTYIIYLSTAAGTSQTSNQTIVKNFNLKTGELITLSDLFIEGYEESVKDIILEKLQKRLKNHRTGFQKHEGSLTDGDIYITDNYVIGKNMITFIYCEDEIVSHEYGEVRVDLSKSELKKYLK